MEEAVKHKAQSNPCYVLEKTKEVTYNYKQLSSAKQIFLAPVCNQQLASILMMQ